MSKPLSAAQKLFNRVCRHLLRQNKQALNEDRECVYRAPDGCRCGVGGVLPNRLYKKEFEGTQIVFLMRDHPEVRDYFGDENSSLLSSIQYVHDNFQPHEWPARLAIVAERHSLTVPSVK